MSTTTRNAEHAVQSGVDKAKEVAGNVADRAKDVAGNVADRAKQFASQAGDKADSAAGRVGDALGTAADKVREYAPREGMMSTAANKVADTLESGGKYLSKEGVTGLSSDIAEMIKKNPVPALLIGLGLGYLLARATSRS